LPIFQLCLPPDFSLNIICYQKLRRFIVSYLYI
jgi:hypothetical protein